MKIRFDSDGKSVGGKIYFAVVEEVMIDKDGRPVAPKSTERPEPVTVAPAAAPASETMSAPTIVNVNDGVAEKFDELNKKIERLIDIMSQEKPVIERERIIEKLVNIPVAATEQKEEKPVEQAPAEKEPEAEEAIDITALAEEEPEEETAEEIAEEAVEETAEEAVEELAPEAVEEPAESTEDEAIETVAAAIDVSADVGVEEPAEEVAEEIAVPAVDTEVAVTDEVPPKKDYVRSPTFAEKMMASSEILQDRYDDLKNYALRFRKLKSRISKKFDSINQGRFHFVKLSVAGKTLKLYLNMDINTVDPKFRCHDMSDKKTYVTVPVLLRIKSGRAVKYAKRLIDQCAEQHGMLERRKPFVVDSIALIEEALAAKEGNNAEVEFDEIETLDDSAMTDSSEE